MLFRSTIAVSESGDNANTTLNNRLNAPKLILVKAINDGDGTLTNKEFNFTITLKLPSGDVSASCSLKGGESVTSDVLFPGLTIPVGTAYEVTELRPDGSKWYVTSGTVNFCDNNIPVSGTTTIDSQLGYGENTVTFTNSTDPYGTLTVKKTVKGNFEEDKTRDWTFNIKIGRASCRERV